MKIVLKVVVTLLVEAPSAWLYFVKHERGAWLVVLTTAASLIVLTIWAPELGEKRRTNADDQRR